MGRKAKRGRPKEPLSYRSMAAGMRKSAKAGKATQHNWNRMQIWRDEHYVDMCKRFPYMKKSPRRKYDRLGNLKPIRPEDYKKGGWSKTAVLRLERTLRSMPPRMREKAEKAALRKPNPKDPREAQKRLFSFVTGADSDILLRRLARGGK